MNHPAPAIKANATYRDVLDAPAGMVAELVAGRLHLSPRPASRHARANVKLGSRLADPNDDGEGGTGGWFVATGAVGGDDAVSLPSFEAISFPLSSLWT